MKVAIIGVWHVHAGDYTKTAKEFGQVVGVYDSNAEWKNNFAKSHEIKAFDTLDDLLNSEAEGVIICNATNEHKDVMIKAARKGKHIFTEKVLTLTEKDALEVKAEVEKANVNFVISFPHKVSAYVKTVKALCESGVIGEINYFRFRNCHNGSTAHWLPSHFYDKDAAGGGAMVDLGAHGMYLTEYFLGEPVTYKSSFTHFCRDEKDRTLNPSALEDNAVTVMTFENGAIAVNETGFVSVGSPLTLEVGGSLGYIRYTDSKVTLKTAKKSEEVPLEEGDLTPIRTFLSGKLQKGAGIDDAVTLTRMMEKAYRF